MQWHKDGKQRGLMDLSEAPPNSFPVVPIPGFSELGFQLLLELSEFPDVFLTKFLVLRDFHP